MPSTAASKFINQISQNRRFNLRFCKQTTHYAKIKNTHQALTPMNFAIEGLRTIINEILSAQQDGISEYDLLKALAIHNVSLFNEDYFNDTLGLFQRHFLLFHCLYLLRNKLRADRQGDISIHCMNIQRIASNNAPSSHPALPDPLAAYYLDLGNLKSTDESDVLRMLNNFWIKFAGNEHRDEALAVMELSHPSSYSAIKQQYRRLAMQWHPDRGGNLVQFQRLEWAMEILRDLYPHQ